MSVPPGLQAGVISRVKILANLDISEKRVPQDGRFSVSLGGTKVDLRVATLPTIFGEEVVMRLLDTSNLQTDLAALGFSARDLDRYREVFERPYGTILVTGPTGSGKSTTLYATLNRLNSPQRKIITIEDPVEYRMPGINQIQVNPKAGLTFASGLRSILRNDPDVVMVGEIRDPETAKTGVDRPPGPGHPSHQRRPLRRDQAHGDGRRAVPHLLGGGLRYRPEARQETLREVQGTRAHRPRDPRGHELSRRAGPGGVALP
jgi:type IV pilus assembly protein PilB